MIINNEVKNKVSEEITNNTKFVVGEVYDLKVVRVNEVGAFLDAQTGNTSDDILLYRLQQKYKVKIGEVVKVYLYKDPKGRLTASMNLPKIKIGEVALLEVLHITKDGAFVDTGAERGVFLPFTEMRGRIKAEQKILVKLYRDKTGRYAVSMRVEEDLKQLAVSALEKVKVGDMITGNLYNILPEGYFFFSPEKYIFFVHNDEVANNSTFDYGQEITARVTFVREDGHLNASLRPLKQVAMVTDAERIYEFMKNRGGSMPYTDDTPAEVIRKIFSISKSSFKRALGQLLKRELIVQNDKFTEVIKEHDGTDWV